MGKCPICSEELAGNKLKRCQWCGEVIGCTNVCANENIYPELNDLDGHCSTRCYNESIEDAGDETSQSENP